MGREMWMEVSAMIQRKRFVAKSQISVADGYWVQVVWLEVIQVETEEHPVLQPLD